MAWPCRAGVGDRGRGVARCSAAATAHEYKLRVPERRPAGQGRRRPDRRPPRRLGPRDQADRQQPGRGARSQRRRALRAAARRARTAIIRATSLSGIANRYIALTPGAELGDEAPRRRDARAPTRRPASSTSTSSSTRSTRRRAGACRTSSRARDAVRRASGAQANHGAEYFNPCLSRPRASWSTSSTATRRRCTRLHRQHLAARSRALAERRDDLVGLVGNTNTTAAAIARRERRARPARSALLPTTLRNANTTFVNLRATLDDLDMLVDASKPGDEGPRAVPARAAPARRRARARRSATSRRWSSAPAPDNDLIDLPAAAAGASSSVAKPALPALDPGAAPSASRCSSSSGPTRPSSIGWFRDFGQGDRQLRRQRPLRAHRADLQRLPVHRQPDAAATLDADPAAQRFDRPADRRRQALPGRRHARPPADGSAPFTDDGNLGLRPEPRAPGPDEAPRSPSRAVLARGRRRWCSPRGAGRRRRRLPASARSSTTRSP